MGEKQLGKFLTLSLLTGLAGGMWVSCAVASEPCDKASGNAALMVLQNSNDMEKHRQMAVESGGSDPLLRRVNGLKFSTSVELMNLVSDARQKVLLEYKNGCSVGDAVSIPTAWSSIVKEVCDFGKSIVTVGDSIFCMVR